MRVAVWSFANQSSKYQIIFARGFRATLNMCYFAEITFIIEYFIADARIACVIKTFISYESLDVESKRAKRVSIDVTDIVNVSYNVHNVTKCNYKMTFQESTYTLSWKYYKNDIWNLGRIFSLSKLCNIK